MAASNDPATKQTADGSPDLQTPLQQEPTTPAKMLSLEESRTMTSSSDTPVQRPRRGTLTPGGTSPPPASALPPHLAGNVRHSRAPSIANVSVLDTLYFEDVTTSARSEHVESPLMSPGASATPSEYAARPWGSEDGVRLEGEAESSAMDPRLALEGALQDADESELATAPFSFATPDRASAVLEQILQPAKQSPGENPAYSRRGSLQLGDDLPDRRVTSPAFMEVYPSPGLSARDRTSSLGGPKSVGRWWKDWKEKKKEMTRSHAARVHAAVAVAGVASAVAAVTAATAASATDEASTKTSIAVAAAAALIAAQCVEVAEGLGANKDDLSSVVSSAVNVKSAGDIVTATAQAATALRASATLRARQPVSRGGSSSRVAPTGSNLSRGHGSGSQLSDSQTDDGNEGDSIRDEELASTRGLMHMAATLGRGHELLKRSKKGDLHYRRLSVYLDRHGCVALRLQKKVMGAIMRGKKRPVNSIETIPAWAGRELLQSLDGQETLGQRHFCIRTGRKTLEFEARTDAECTMFIEGIGRLLAYASTLRPLQAAAHG